MRKLSERKIIDRQQREKKQLNDKQQEWGRGRKSNDKSYCNEKGIKTKQINKAEQNNGY